MKLTRQRERKPTLRYARALARLEIERCLLDKAWSLDELAKGTGLARGTVSNLISGTNDAAVGRAKIEKAMGRRIWSQETAKEL